MATTESSESRKTRFLAALQTAAEGIREAAKIYLEMRHAGDDTSFIRPGLRQTLTAIAEGRMLPEVYTAFSGPLQKKLMAAPLEVQRQVVEGKTLPLLVHKGDQVETLQVTPASLNPVLLHQMFGPDGPRLLQNPRSSLHSRQRHNPTSIKEP